MTKSKHDENKALLGTHLAGLHNGVSPLCLDVEDAEDEGLMFSSVEDTGTTLSMALYGLNQQDDETFGNLEEHI